MITRERALELLKEHVKTKNLVKHCLATEVVMKSLAKVLDEDEEKWGITGLLHDLDYDYTKENPDEHGLKTVEILKNEDVPEDVINAILAHCGKKEPETLMEKALYAVDPTTGFIVAAALIRPEKKLEVLDVDFLLRRFKEKAFARGANRDQIKSCEEIGLSLEKFLEISLEAMKSISSELGL
ncbi:HDIG domain-containing metalloprotein [Thermotoga sp. KOL6]|uniref:HDIG domain-containing metalloprotein n=1 Tax=Thermotoga sp. KOL6 TaxID=126741 RepID=UPI000C78C238|nr:HDIG domain-containing metalloprotein [Thermotoga sp. KOL6]PLV60358.1 phosphohydrolase [Thermotoga sp. KOL6]